jgi:hypothetical protein
MYFQYFHYHASISYAEYKVLEQREREREREALLLYRVVLLLIATSPPSSTFKWYMATYINQSATFLFSLCHSRLWCATFPPIRIHLSH